jgi:predicted dehydrogenase
MIMTINAGHIPADHWVHDPKMGGGRIIGEACHFVDLLRFLAASSIEKVAAIAMDAECSDSVSIHLEFKNGSIGVINYLANGSKSLPKERLEVFCNGSVLQLDNFRILRGFGWPGFKRDKLWRQDKGQFNCAKAFIDAVNSGESSQLIAFEELVEVTQACLDTVEQIS